MMSMAWSFLMLLLVLALIPATLWTLKRVQNFRPPGQVREMKVTSQVALGARERVVMVRVRGHELILGVTPNQVTLLGEATAHGIVRGDAR